MASPRIIAVTGASSGIGRAVAVRLARDGASLAICARRGDRLGQVAAEIEAAGGRALPFVGDVASEQDMAEFVRLSLERYQRLDVMVCNAGLGVANAIARAIEHPVPEVYPHALSRGLVWLNALAPGFCDRFVRKYGRKPQDA